MQEHASAELPGFYEALMQAYDLSGSLVSAWREAVLTGPLSALLQQPALSYLADFSDGFESVSQARFIERCREAEDYFASAGEGMRRRFSQLRQTALSFGILGAILVFIIVV